MWQRGELSAHQLSSGTIIVDVPPTTPTVRPQKVAVYARVSSAQNRMTLDSQAERGVAFCAAKGWPVAQVVKECGSGVNDQRPQLLALLAGPTISHIVVEHGRPNHCLERVSVTPVIPMQESPVSFRGTWLLRRLGYQGRP
jgi:predicted site-specific integrase-resolvase